MIETKTGPLIHWKSSKWSYSGDLKVSYSDEFGGIEVGTSHLHGPGWDWWKLEDNDFFINFQSTFVLRKDRMPTKGCTFLSRPVVQYRGEICGWGGQEAITNSPHVNVDIRARQTIWFLGLFPLGPDDWTKHVDWHLGEDPWLPFNGVDCKKLPAQKGLTAAYFEMAKNQDLFITVDVEVDFEIRGGAELTFENASHEELGTGRFLLKVPQWTIDQAMLIEPATADDFEIVT